MLGVPTWLPRGPPGGFYNLGFRLAGRGRSGRRVEPSPIPQGSDDWSHASTQRRPGAF